MLCFQSNVREFMHCVCVTPLCLASMLCCALAEIATVSIWVTGPLTLNRVTWPLTLDQVSGPLTLDWVSWSPTLDFGHFLNPLAPSKCHHSAKFARNPSFIGAVRYRSTLLVYKCCHTSFFAMFYTFFPNSTDRVT